jgi:MoxR-like ATPase
MDGIRDRQHFLRMITDTRDVYQDDVPPELKIRNAELDAWDREIDAVEVPAEVLNTLQVVRARLEEYNSRPDRAGDPLQVYDRRWKKIVRLLRTSAFLDGRSQVSLMDAFLMVHCLWSHPDQAEAVEEIVGDTIRRHGYAIAVNLAALRREIEAYEAEIQAETRIRRVVAEDRLLPVQEEYYEFIQTDKLFEGTLLRIEEFNRLEAGEWQTVNIYDSGKVLRHRLKARKSSREHSLDISFNSVEQSYPLRTHKVERSEILLKKPHRLVEQHWNERFGVISEYIAAQQRRLAEEAPDQLRELEAHLFVDPRRAALVRANQEEVAAALHQLQLRLEKAQYGYAQM